LGQLSGQIWSYSQQSYDLITLGTRSVTLIPSPVALEAQPTSPSVVLEAVKPSQVSSEADIFNSAFENILIGEAFPRQPVQLPPLIQSPLLRRRFSFTTPQKMETPNIPSPGWDPSYLAMVTSNPLSNPASDPSSFLGSKTNPNIIQADPEFPERHREFDIKFVKSMKHGDYFCLGYHIRTKVGEMDPDHWSATMCQEAEYKSGLSLSKGPLVVVGLKTSNSIISVCSVPRCRLRMFQPYQSLHTTERIAGNSIGCWFLRRVFSWTM
jgi:hypothetical protein